MPVSGSTIRIRSRAEGAHDCSAVQGNRLIVWHSRGLVLRLDPHPLIIPVQSDTVPCGASFADHAAAPNVSANRPQASTAFAAARRGLALRTSFQFLRAVFLSRRSRAARRHLQSHPAFPVSRDSGGARGAATAQPSRLFVGIRLLVEQISRRRRCALSSPRCRCATVDFRVACTERPGSSALVIG